MRNILKKDEVSMDNKLDDIDADVRKALDNAVDTLVEPHNPFDFDAAEGQFENSPDTILDQGGAPSNQPLAPELNSVETTTDNVNKTETISPDGTVSIKDLSVISSQTKKYTETYVKYAIRKYSELMKREEDIRANHRNRNRIMILTVALIGLFTIPIIIESVLQAPGLLKFSAAISVVPDFALTLYALIRKY